VVSALVDMQWNSASVDTQWNRASADMLWNRASALFAGVARRSEDLRHGNARALWTR